MLVEKDADLTHLPGIDDDLSAKIKEIVSTSRCSLLQRLHKELPPAIAELLKIPGIGPKRVKTLYHDLDVQTVEQFYTAQRVMAIFALCQVSAKKLNSIFFRRLKRMLIRPDVSS